MLRIKMIKLFSISTILSLFIIILSTNNVFAGWVTEPDSWNVPDKWYMNSENGTAARDTSEKNGGSYSIKLNGSSSVGTTIVITNNTWNGLVNATSYTIKVLYKALGGYDGIPRISVRYINCNGALLSDDTGKTTRCVNGQSGDRNAWTVLEEDITIPAGTCRLLIQLETEGTAGNVWFDDIDVHDNYYPGANKALNPGFETKYNQISDQNFFGVWDSNSSTWTTTGKINYSYNSELSALETAVKNANGNYANARTEYLNYFKNRTQPQMPDTMGDRNSTRPTSIPNYQTYWADRVLEHDFDQAFMKTDIDWNVITNQSNWIFMNCLNNPKGEADKIHCKLSMTMKGGSTLGARDYSSNSNNGTVSGTGAEWSCTRIGDTTSGGALKLTDSNTYVRVEDSNSLDITNDLSIEGWFRYSGTVAQAYAVHKDSAYRLLFADSNGKPAASVYVDGAWRTVTSPDSVAADKWYHLAMTYSSTTKRLDLYVNGMLKVRTTLSGLAAYTINASSSWLAVGRSSSGTAYNFSGFMDQFRISDTARMIDVGVSLSSDANTKLLFYFNEPSGATVEDLSENGNNGTIQSTGYYRASSVQGESFKTNGTGYIAVADSSSLDFTDELTISGWFRFNGSASDKYVLQKGDAYGLKLADSSGHPVAAVYINGEWISAVADSVTVQPNIWYHLGMTYSSTRKELKIYVNGVLAKTTTLSSSAQIATNSTELRIGRDLSGTYFDGYIENVCMSNSTLLEFPEPVGAFTGTLDEMYWNTGNEIYADELLQQIIDWIKDNQYREYEYDDELYFDPYGALNAVLPGQWDTLWMAQRMDNIVWYMQTLRNSTSLTAERFTAIMKSLYEHEQDQRVRHLNSFNAATFTSNVAYKLAVMHPYFNASPEWQNFFINRIYYFEKNNFYPDGMDDECTPGYHDFQRSSFEAVKKFAEANEIQLPAGYSENIEKMYEYDMYCTMPDGTIPQFGDADNEDFRSIVYEGGVTFSRDDMKYVGSGGSEGTVPAATSIGFPYGGQYFMRTGWGINDNYMAMDMGPVGTCHGHADNLSFILYAYGQYFLADTGRITYNTSESGLPWLRYSQGGHSHNEMVVDCKGQHYVDATIGGSAEPLSNSSFTPTKYFDFAQGVFNSGYSALLDDTNPDTSVSQTRKVLFVKKNDYDYWILHDIAKVNSGTHTIDDQFQFTPLTLEVDPDTKVAYTNTGAANLRIIPVDPSDINDYSTTSGAIDTNGNPTGGWISYQCYTKYAAPQLKYTKTSVSADTNFDYILYPVKPGTNPTITADRLIASQNGISLPKTKASVIKVNVSGTNENDYTMISNIGTGDKAFGTQGTDKIVSDAEVTFIKRDSSSNAIISFMLMNGRKIVDNGTDRMTIYTDKNKNNITVRYSGNTIEIVTDMDFNNGDAVRIYGTDISSVTVNSTSTTYKTDGSYIVVGKAPYLPVSTNRLLLHFNEMSGNIAADSSPRSDITTTGGAIWIDGKYGKAFKFDGTNYINVSDTDNYAGLDITDNLTVECWAKWDGTGDGYMLMKGNAYGVKLNSGHGIDGVVCVDNQWRVVQSDYVISPNTWTHIAMTYSSTTHDIKIYANGVLQKTNTLSGLGSYTIYSSSDDFTVGRDAQNWGEIFCGAIDEVCVANTVKNSFDQTIPLLCDSYTRLLLNFNEGQGSVVADSSGKNGATATGGSRHVSAKFGGAAEFIGSNYISVADSNSLDITADLTVECWAKWSGTSDGYILMKGDAYGLKLNSVYGIDGVVYVAGEWRACQSGYIMRVNEWTHIAMTYYAALHKMRIYVNGVLRQTMTLPDGLGTYYINSNANELNIGRDAKGWNQYFYGCVDEVRVSDTLRYNSMLDVPLTSDDDTALLLHFDENSGATATDSSSNGNNGSFQISTARVNGKYAGAIETNNSRYFTVSDSNSLDITDNLTVEGWFKRSGNDGYMLMKGNAYGIKLNSCNGIDAVVYVDGGWRVVQSGYVMPENQWTHAAMTYSSSTMGLKIYVNGELKATNTLSGLNTNDINTSTYNLMVGRDAMGWGQYFAGCIDEVCISNTVKSSFPFAED